MAQCEHICLVLYPVGSVTSHLPRALEDKKKAMVAAEEDRRKKALEERREAQKAATKRFRSALGRIKSTSTKGHGQTAKNTSQAFLECKHCFW